MSKSIKFGEMLSEALHVIKACEKNSIQIIQDEIGYELGRAGGSSIVKWRSGVLPPELEERLALAKILIRRSMGRLDQKWLESFLKCAKHPFPEIVKAELFPNDSTVSLSGKKYAAQFQLRSSTSDFVGRKDERQVLGDFFLNYLDKKNTVSAISGIRGLGGIGKTELAINVAHDVSSHFPDAQIVVNLLGSTNLPMTPKQALSTIISSIKPELSLPDDITALRDLYLTLLKGKNVFILADDAFDSDQIRLLVPPTGCALLVTSRNRFKLPGMKALDLNVLPDRESIELLLKICPRIQGFEDKLSRLCGGLPLALRVCATLLSNDKTLALDSYIEKLNNEREKLNLLKDPDDLMLDVKATLSLSYHQLPKVAQDILCQLWIFPSSFDFLAAQQIVHLDSSPSVDLQTSLSLLFRRSLVEYHDYRFSLHALVNAMSREFFSGLQNQLAYRHASYYYDVLLEAEDQYKHGGEHMLAGLALLDKERLHIDAGQNWALQESLHNQEAADLFVKYSTSAHYVKDIRYDMENERIPRLKFALKVAEAGQMTKQLADISSELGYTHKNLGDFLQSKSYFIKAPRCLRRRL